MSENTKSSEGTPGADERGTKREALDEFLPQVYDELKRIAAYKLAAERPHHTLQPTALLHEAYLRMASQHSADWGNRAHFFAMASEMMRRILVNYAETRNAKKRNEGKTMISLDEAESAAADEMDLVELDAALKELIMFDPAQARIVELK